VIKISAGHCVLFLVAGCDSRLFDNRRDSTSAQIAAMSRRSTAIVQQLVAARAAAAACGQQQQQMNMLAINGARFMSSANPCHKDGKVLHPDLLNENLKKTQVIAAVGSRDILLTNSLDPQQQLLTLSPSQSRPAAPLYH
jgi:hypothetical protein